MAITYRILSDKPNGLHTHSIWVILKNTDPSTSYRRVELVVGNEIVDVGYHIDTVHPLPELWAMGSVSDDGEWKAALEKTRTENIYDLIVRRVFDYLVNNDLDSARTAALQLIGQSEALMTDFGTIRVNLALPGGSLTDDQKREQLLWIILLSVIGKMNADAA